jgi:hypothetical protein
MEETRAVNGNQQWANSHEAAFRNEGGTQEMIFDAIRPS